MQYNSQNQEAFDKHFYDELSENDQLSLAPWQAKLADVIESAKRKLNTKSENELCRYIPHPLDEEPSPSFDDGSEMLGYIHHFTWRKLKSKHPKKLIELIEKFILMPSQPVELAPKQRAARGSRKKNDQIVFSRSDLERMLNMARIAGDKEMIRKLTPKMDLRSIKKELIASIREGKAKSELWEAFVEATTQPAQSHHSQVVFAH